MDLSASKPKIIVFTTAYRPFIGGAEIAVEEISKRLKNKFDFIIVTSRMRKDLPSEEVYSEGKIIRLGFGTVIDKYLLPIFSLFVIRKLMKKKENLFFGLDLSFGAAAAAICKIFYPKIPFIFNIQYGYGDERIKKGRGGIIGRMFKFILNQADCVTAISNYLLNVAHDYGYIGEEKVIHNGVDTNNFQFPRLPIGGQAIFNFQKKSNVIITVSRLVPKNGIDVLIRAMAELKKIQPPTSNFQLLVIGDGSERSVLESLANEITHPPTPSLTLREGEKGGGTFFSEGGLQIKFLGEVPYDEIPKHLSQADIFVRPSRSEGMGNAFVEALSAGLPIIGTPVGGILDIIKDKETGLFAKIDDPKDLAEKIKTLLNNKELLARIVDNGQKMVREKFSWDKIADDYEKIFNSQLFIKKRVLIATGLYPPDVGGPATYSKILLDELPKKNIGVKILSFGLIRKYPRVLRHTLYFFRALRFARNADAVFAQDPVSVGLPAMLAAKILRKKFLLKIVGDYAWEQYMQKFSISPPANWRAGNFQFSNLEEFQKSRYDFFTEARRFVERFVAKKADFVIVPSEYLKKIVLMWGVPENKIHVVYNSFEIPNVNILKDEARRQLGVSGKVVVSAGRNVPWKGFEALKEAINELKQEIPEIKLFIFHDEPKEKLFMYLRAADVFVLNTAYEGLSHQILEAMALGVPVVTTDIGGNPELIKDGESGFLVDYNDKEALKSRILEILKNPERAKKFSENAKQKAQEFSKERMIKNTIDTLLD